MDEDNKRYPDGTVTISLDEYRDLLIYMAKASDYAEIKEFADSVKEFFACNSYHKNEFIQWTNRGNTDNGDTSI